MSGRTIHFESFNILESWELQKLSVSM